MPDRVGCIIVVARTALLGVSFAALTASAQAAEYKMTVNRDRLVNSANEPQNWLMMNGDYGSTRYSKLAQINRDNVKRWRCAACRTSARTVPRTRSIP
jgi:alcohol dehydrogenase (cytochrome c)